MNIPLQLASMFGLVIIMVVFALMWQHFFVDLPKKRRRKKLLDVLDAIDVPDPE